MSVLIRVSIANLTSFLLLAPHDKMEEMLRHWRVYTLDNDGTDRTIPNDYTKNEKQSGLWWRNLVAGGVAGAVSRSCTAPLERTRIFLQVKGTGTKMSIFGTLNMMVKEGGVKSLWRGKTTISF
jgi:solute carrier family 25 phosphate transporter 23/24/25/41